MRYQHISNKMWYSKVVLLVFAALTQVNFGESKAVHYDPDLRIVGGEEATPHEAPYVVFVQNYKFSNKTGKYGWFSCGGSLLSQRYVLTAAHCVWGSTKWRVYLGKHDMSKLKEPGEVMLEGDASLIVEAGKSFNDDVAIISLNSSVTYTDHIKAVTLISCADKDKEFANERGIPYGWGDISNGGVASDVLKKANLTVISQKFCRQETGHLYDTNTCTIAPTGQGVCYGDSGGPLMVTGFQLGVMSRLGGSNGCAMNKPDIYAHVGKFLSFIKKNSDVTINC